jgi:hypothetical protein
MRLSGWIFMISAWSMIIGLAVFCFKKVFEKGMDAGENEDNNKPG